MLRAGLRRAGGLVRASQRPQARVQRNINGGDRQIGDYPNLPWESAQTRDPYKYWDKQDRRNYNQPLHEQDEVLGVWVFDYDNYITKGAALGYLVGAFATLAGVGFAARLWYSPARNPAGPREFPYNNLEEARGGYPLPTKNAAAIVADE